MQNRLDLSYNGGKYKCFSFLAQCFVFFRELIKFFYFWFAYYIWFSIYVSQIQPQPISTNCQNLLVY